MNHLRVSVSLWLAIASASSAFAQTSRVESGSAVVGRIAFYYETRLEPPIPSLGESLNMVIQYTGDTIHRLMLDRQRKVYFGYDVRVGYAPGMGDGESLYTVEFGPLTAKPELNRGDAEAWRQLPAPRFPEQKVIRAGDVLQLPLLTNDNWGQRLIEYVTVGEAPAGGFNPTRRREFSFPSGAARNFAATDALLTLTEPYVRYSRQSIVGGRRVGELRSVALRGDASGGIVWVYVPGAGRFLLSLVPRGEFARAGTVQGTTLAFNVAGNTYNLNSATRIVPGDAVFNVYVLQQPTWKPTYENANVDTVHIGAADRAEYLLEP